MGLEYKDFIMTMAVIIGPFGAVQIQRVLEKIREKKQRRLDIFKTLMSTRAEKLNRAHVQALNMIDIEFYGRMIPIIRTRYQRKTEQAVTHAWKIYNSHLNKLNEFNNFPVWSARTDELFTELLYALAQSLNYDFDKVQLQRDCYRPQAHGELENLQGKILVGLEKVLSGESSLPMRIVNIPVVPDEQDVVSVEKTQYPEQSDSWTKNEIVD